MTNPQENIEIHEPPLEQFTKRRSCARRSCLSGCSFIIIIVISSIVLLNIFGKPKPKRIQKLPKNIPTEIPIYDTQNIERIERTKGATQSPILESIALIPKNILVPIIQKYESTNFYTNTKSGFNTTKLKNYLEEPIGDHREIISIEWTNLPAEPSFIQDFYITELEKIKAQITKTDNTIIFSTQKISGTLRLEDSSKNSGTDFLILTLKLEN